MTVRSADEIVFWSATETAARVRARDITAAEVTECHLARLDAVNPELNAVTRIDESALDQARAVDAAIAAGSDPGPLAGVPVTIKDNVDVAGQSTPNGLAALDAVVATRDAPFVANWRAAGAVIIGRTNTPEFSWRWHTDNPLFGATRNPLRPELTPGGSSGGAAAALAAGVGCIANGNDAGGSLRWPAVCTGTTALRTTAGRVPSHNSTAPRERPPSIDLMAVQGPMARTVADLRLALGAMIGHAGGGRNWRDPAHVPAALLADHRRRAGWALVTGLAGAEPHPAVQAAMVAAVAALDGSGWDPVEVEPPDVAAAARLWATMMNTDFHHVGLAGSGGVGLADSGGVGLAGDRRPLRDTMLELGSPAIARMLDGFDRAGPPVDLAGYIGLFSQRASLLRRWQQLLTERIDVLVLPVALEPAWPVDDDLRSDERLDEIFAANRPLVAINALGLPAAAVPVPLELTGDLPTGVQVVGRRFAEPVVLDAAEAIEAQLAG